MKVPAASLRPARNRVAILDPHRPDRSSEKKLGTRSPHHRRSRLTADSIRHQVELAPSRGLPQGARARSVMQNQLVNGTAPDHDLPVTLRRGATE